MIPDLLPIGSIVSLKNRSKRVMIVGFFAMNDDNEVYDYCGCNYPDGLKEKKEIFVFDKEDIEKTFFIGLKELENEESVIDIIKGIYSDDSD